jgi:hypothetical protein
LSKLRNILKLAFGLRQQFLPVNRLIPQLELIAGLLRRVLLAFVSSQWVVAALAGLTLLPALEAAAVWDIKITSQLLRATAIQ